MSTQQRASTRTTIPEQAAYWLILLGVYLLVGVLFFYSGKGKLFDDDGHAPPALKEQFRGTFIDKVRQTSTGNNQGTASLYLYFASTAVILMLVSRLAPNGTLGAAAHDPIPNGSSS